MANDRRGLPCRIETVHEIMYALAIAKAETAESIVQLLPADVLVDLKDRLVELRGSQYDWIPYMIGPGRAVGDQRYKDLPQQLKRLDETLSSLTDRRE